jgi:DNA anti-recombination protein RmuC
MAVVHLDLNELDKLRSDLKEAQEKAKFLEGKQGQVKVTVVVKKHDPYAYYNHQQYDRGVPSFVIQEGRQIDEQIAQAIVGHAIEYTNLSEVKEHIREEELHKVQNLIRTKDKENKRLSDRIEELKDELDATNKAHKEDIDKIWEDAYATERTKVQTTIESLKEHNSNLSEEIHSLKKDKSNLERQIIENNKTFWDRLKWW